MAPPPLLPDRYLDARRADILEASKRVFVQKGFAAATMHDIAEEAGVSAGNIYRYFASKEDLIRAVTVECERDYATLFEGNGQAVTSPMALLEQAGHEEWHAIREPGGRDRAVLNLESTLVGSRNAEVGTAIAEAMRSTHGLLVRLVAAAQERGEIADGVDPAALAMFLVAATHGVQVLTLQLGDEVDVDATWQVLVQLLKAFTGTAAAPEPQGVAGGASS